MPAGYVMELCIEAELRPCLVTHLKNFYPSHRIFGHMHETLNVDKKIN